MLQQARITSAISDGDKLDEPTFCTECNMLCADAEQWKIHLVRKYHRTECEAQRKRFVIEGRIRPERKQWALAHAAQPNALEAFVSDPEPELYPRVA